MPRLNADEVERALAGHDGWATNGDEIEKTYEFGDFVAAIAFVGRLADLAEAAGHHPDIDIRYNRVRIALTTHDEGGITDKDTALVARFDGVAQG